MKNLLLTVLFLTTQVALAEVLQDRVHSVIKSSGDNPHHIVRFASGRVALVDKHNEAELKQVLALRGATVNAGIDHKSKLVSLSSRADNSIHLKHRNFFLAEDPPAFDPTVISQAQVNEIFERMNANYKRRSECSDRAHVWTHDEFTRSGIKGMKAFIFFTASYINRHNFKWWFHVAPMYEVKTRHGTQKMVLDYQYMDGPAPVKEWSDLMVFSKRPCKITTKFSEYDVNPQTEDCYMIFESMYYRLPADIHQQELQGAYRDGFDEAEVGGAKSRAFFEGSIR